MKNITLAITLISPTLLFARAGFHEPWGKNADLKPMSSNVVNQPKESLAQKGAKQVILFHQNIISPVDGPRSHFRPTSARYTYLAIQKHGFIPGFIMGCDRLMRENKEEWYYRKVEIDHKIYLFDPASTKPPPKIPRFFSNSSLKQI